MHCPPMMQQFMVRPNASLCMPYCCSRILPSTGKSKNINKTEYAKVN